MYTQVSTTEQVTQSWQVWTQQRSKSVRRCESWRFLSRAAKALTWHCCHVCRGGMSKLSIKTKNEEETGVCLYINTTLNCLYPFLSINLHFLLVSPKLGWDRFFKDSRIPKNPLSSDWLTSRRKYFNIMNSKCGHLSDGHFLWYTHWITAHWSKQWIQWYPLLTVHTVNK